MAHCFVTIRDPASYLAGWADVLDPDARSADVFDRFCRFVWNQGRRDFRGSWVYDTAEERESDIEALAAQPDDTKRYKANADKAQDEARATPTIEELGRRFISEELHEDPDDYGLS